MTKDAEVERAQDDRSESLGFAGAGKDTQTDAASDTERGAAGKRVRNAAARRGRRSPHSPWAAPSSARGADGATSAADAPGLSEPSAKQGELISIAAAPISSAACANAAAEATESASSLTAYAAPTLHASPTPSLSHAVPWSGSRKRLYVFTGASIAAGMVIGFLSSPLVGSKRPDARIEAASSVQVRARKSEIASSASDKREIASLQDELRAVRAQIEAMRQTAETERASERLAALEANGGSGVEASRASKQANVDASARIGALEARLDRVERLQADQTPTGAIQKDSRDGAAGRDETKRRDADSRKSASNAPNAATPFAAAVKTGADKTSVRSAIPPGGYVLRAVSDGVALIEGAGGRVKVARGDTLAGAGRVMAIERHGGEWVVLTSRGVIDSQPY